MLLMKILHKWQNIERVVLRHARKDNLGKERNCILDYSEDHSTFGRNLNANCLNSFIQKEKRAHSFLVLLSLMKEIINWHCLFFCKRGLVADFHCRVLGHAGTSHIEKHYEHSRVLVWYLTAFALTPVNEESIPGREILLQLKSVELCPVSTTDSIWSLPITESK